MTTVVSGGWPKRARGSLLNAQGSDPLFVAPAQNGWVRYCVADCGLGDSLSFSSNVNFTITFRAAINPTSLSYVGIITKKGSRGTNRPGFMVKLQGGKLTFQFADVLENNVEVYSSSFFYRFDNGCKVVVRQYHVGSVF